MRVELDDDSTRQCEKLASGLGMSVNSFVNWLVMSASEVNIVEAVTIKIDPQPPLEKARPRFVRYRKSWIGRL
jgi:hypothetical protein